MRITFIFTFFMTLLFLTACGETVLVVVKKETCFAVQTEDGAEITCNGETVEIFNGRDGRDAEQCEVEKTGSGALILCGDKAVFINDGDNPAIEAIDPCGNDEDIEHEEIIIRFSNNLLVSHFKDGKKTFMTKLEPGKYVTSDKQRCAFEIDNNYELLE